MSGAPSVSLLRAVWLAAGPSRRARDPWLCVPASQRVCPEQLLRVLAGSGRPDRSLSFLDERTSKRSQAGADAPTRMGSSAQRRRRGLSRAGSVWLYVIALAGAAAVCWIAFVHQTQPLMQPALPLWTVAGGFLCAELCVVHLQFRRSAHSFSLGDVPFVFGLVFLSGDALGMVALVGTG